MAVVVKRFRVRAGGRTYSPGEIIGNLDKKEEKALVEAGYCEYVIEQKDNDKKTKSNKSQSNPKNGQDTQSAKDDDGPNTDHPLVGEGQ